MKRIFFCLLVFFINSCDKVHISSIPYYQVYLELDLTFEDKDLLPTSAYKIFTSPKNINQSIEKTGFGGVLVYHGLDGSGADAYYAFDMACPYEANRSVTVEVDEDHLHAVCPKCRSKYELMFGLGNPVSGPAREQLKPYQVSVSGNKIYVRN
ncbi:MAG: (2Fe-2S)-binding protein [Tannerellaceae bacterium]|jgi:nitrite reductase/ring-hydroxylating ferredoxin subunit|nr:(2Fe-2S)-binding protein [Tannerellaceae bacterium]